LYHLNIPASLNLKAAGIFEYIKSKSNAVIGLGTLKFLTKLLAGVRSGFLSTIAVTSSFFWR